MRQLNSAIVLFRGSGYRNGIRAQGMPSAPKVRENTLAEKAARAGLLFGWLVG